MNVGPECWEQHKLTKRIPMRQQDKQLPSRLALKVSVESWLQWSGYMGKHEPHTDFCTIHWVQCHCCQVAWLAAAPHPGGAATPRLCASVFCLPSQPGRSHILYISWVVSTGFIYCNTLCWASVFIFFLLCHCTSFLSNQGFPNGS